MCQVIRNVFIAKGEMMEQMTITEALAEIKLIEKKASKKQETILANLTSMEHLPDVYKEVGGTKEMVKREYQGLNDLWKRLTVIREAIAKSNAETKLTVEGHTRSVNQWLAWKREVQDKQIEFIGSVISKTKQVLDREAAAPRIVKSNDPVNEPTLLVKITSNIDIPAMTKDQDIYVTLKEKLDGQLSLKNATTTLTFE